MPIDISKVVNDLEQIVDRAVGQSRGGIASEAERAQILASFATYKAQDLSVIKLMEANEINARSQAATIGQLVEQAKSTKKLVTWTAILAVGTLTLALVSVASLVLQHVH